MKNAKKNKKKVLRETKKKKNLNGMNFLKDN